MFYIWLVLLGVATGLIGAMLGLGGSILLIPALNEVHGQGAQQHLHQAVAMIINFFVVTPATWRHARAGVVSGRVVGATIPGSLVGVLIGVQLSELTLFQGTRQVYLTALFGVFMVLIAGYQILQFSAHEGREASGRAGAPSFWKVAVCVGLPTGLISGLLGVGGGIIAVPAQQVMLRLPLREAIGNSAATICGLSFVGAMSKNYAWMADAADPLQPVKMAMVLVPFVIGGSLLGSSLTHLLPRHVVRGVLVVVLLIGGMRQVMHVFS